MVVSSYILAHWALFSDTGPMLKYFFILLLPLTSFAEDTTMPNAYDFSFTSIEGDALPLSQFKGQLLLVVNTASQCHFTPQYEELETIYQRYKNRGFVVLGVPSNDFAHQDPATEADIASFCKLRYGVTFPLTSKEAVKGDGAHPFYQWAAGEVRWLGRPKWNFHKYLIGRDGKVIDWFASNTAPDSDKIINAIEKNL